MKNLERRNNKRKKKKSKKRLTSHGAGKATAVLRLGLSTLQTLVNSDQKAEFLVNAAKREATRSRSSPRSTIQVRAALQYRPKKK